MIEVIYKEEKQEATGNEGLFSIPRNIRQIGLVDENCRIYMEDYVYTFLNKLAGENPEKQGHAAVLVGDTKWSKGVSYLFARGALAVEGMEAATDHIDFTEEVWQEIQEEKRKYFPDYEIVGWFFARQQLPMEMTDVFARAHLKHFGGEKVLMLMDAAEREEAFFRYENDHMIRQSGYYIFYEKNPLMQAYMIEKNKGLPVDSKEESSDEAVKTFRKIIRGKKEEKPEETEGGTSVFSYAATACLAIAVLTVGVNFYRSYEQPAKESQNLEQTQETSSVITQQPVPTMGVEAKTTITPAIDEKTGSAATPTAAISKSATQDLANGEKSDSAAAYSQEADMRKEQKSQAAADEAQTGEQTDMQTDEQAEEGANVQTSDQTANQTDVQTSRQSDSQTEVQTNGQAGAEQEVSGDAVHSSYVIRPGDTLYDISLARYGNMEAIEEICRLNGLTEDEVIYPGQVIVLP